MPQSRQPVAVIDVGSNSVRLVVYSGKRRVPVPIFNEKVLAGLGKGPGHSLVVLPDKKKAAVNVAGDNLIVFLDLEHATVDGTLQTGAFP